MPTTLRITPPADYSLSRDACSYGYFLLDPNHWSPSAREFSTTLDVSDPVGRAGRAATTVFVTQPARTRGSALSVRADRALTPAQRSVVRAALTRMLRLDEPASEIAAFHRLDPRWKRSGRGRLMRSASLFEDVIKTVTSCNVAWPSTIVMNRRLCEVAGAPSPSGRHAFPLAATVARMRANTLRARCRVGYRDARIIELAKMFVRGEILPAVVEGPASTDDVLNEQMQGWPGIGPYAAANILQLLGRYSRLPLDSESVRHGTSVLGFTGAAPHVMKKVHAHFEPFGEHRFRSYWFELWAFYESKRGKSWTWERETTGKTFTASALAD